VTSCAVAAAAAAAVPLAALAGMCNTVPSLASAAVVAGTVIQQRRPMLVGAAAITWALQLSELSWAVQGPPSPAIIVHVMSYTVAATRGCRMSTHDSHHTTQVHNSFNVAW